MTEMRGYKLSTYSNYINIKGAHFYAPLLYNMSLEISICNLCISHRQSSIIPFGRTHWSAPTELITHNPQLITILLPAPPYSHNR
jgi:hypothetical protein